MDTKKKVEEWGKRMGYKGNIPNCFKNICGPETVHIWEQLVTKIKPKDEIEHIQRNIIIKELNGNLPQHSMGRCKEIQVYNKRKELKTKKINLSEEIAEKIENLENLERMINFKYAQNEKLKEQIKGNKQKEFLYKQKSLDFEKNIRGIQAKLSVIKNNGKCLNNQDEKEILETLNKLSHQINSSKQQKKRSITNSISSISTETIIFESIKNSVIEQSQFFDVEIDKTRLNQKIEILNDKNFLEDIKKALFKHDHNLAAALLSNLIDGVKAKIVEIVSNKSCLNPKRFKKLKSLDFVYAEDIKNRLMIIKCNKMIGKEEGDFEENLNDVCVKIDFLNLNPNEIESIRELIQLKLKEIETTATLETLQSKLNDLETDSTLKNDLESIELKTASLEKKLIDCDRKLDDIVSLSQEITQSIKDIQRETRLLMSGLQRLTAEVATLTFLLEKSLNVKEIETFKNYDLFFNRKVQLKNGEICFVRNLLNGFTDNLENDDCLKNLRGSLRSFYSFYSAPEMIVTELIRNKITKNTFNMGLCQVEDVKYQKYSMNQLEDEQVIINRVLNDLEVIHKQNVSIPRSIVTHQEKVMKFWLEMPLDNFVDKTLLFNEHNFEYYKKLYENFYKKL